MTYQEFVEEWNKKSLAPDQIVAQVIDEDVPTIRFYHTSNGKLMMELTRFDRSDGTRYKSLRIEDKPDKSRLFQFSNDQSRLFVELMSSDDLGISSKKYWFPVYSKDSMVGFAIPSYYKVNFSSDFDNIKVYTEDELEFIKDTFEEEEWDDLMKFKQVFVPDKRKEKDNKNHE